MASLTGGGLTGGGSGGASLPAQAGNSGKFLTTDATTASWGTPSTGGLVFLSTTSLAGAAPVIELTGSYDVYVLKLHTTLSASNYLYMRMGTDASTFTTTASAYTYQNVRGTGATASANTSATLSMLRLAGDNNNCVVFSTIEIFAPHSTSFKTTVVGTAFGQAAYTATTGGYLSGAARNDTHIKIGQYTSTPTAGGEALSNFVDGTATLYGMKLS